MEDLLRWIESINPILIYLILFAGSFFENVFPPVPGDTIIVFGAYLVGTKSLSFEYVFISTTIGSIAGFMTIYFFGYLFGKRIVDSKNLRFFSSTEYHKVEKWFNKYGYGVVAANRFLSGARSVISFFAGITKLDIKKVVIFSAISCALWNTVLIYSGYMLGENWENVISLIKNYNKVIFIILTIVLLVLFVKWINNRKKVEKV
ncbi:DedA family protein [candidate division KSB1 bacterium]